MDMAALMGMMSQGGSKGPDPASADDPSVQMGRLFPPMDHLSPEEKSEAMERAFERLKASFDMLAKPDGTQKAPAKNCQTLKTNHPTKPSGDYWIDPNGMDAKDAILAYCDMQTGSTCIQPKPAVSHEITVMSDDKEVWVGELDTNAFDINYKADSNQMNFLQLSSSSAEQIITFHCKDTVAHLNRANNKRHAVSLMAWNDLEIRHRGKARYSVLSDDCQHIFIFQFFIFLIFISGILSSLTNANTRRGLGRRPCSRCSRENQLDCRLLMFKFKTSAAAVKHSRLKWVKSASVRDLVRFPKNISTSLLQLEIW